MNAATLSVTSPDALVRPRRFRRALLWGMLVALLLVAQTLLVALTLNYEAGREQDAAERAANEGAAQLRRELLRQMQQLQTLAFTEQPGETWRQEALALLRARQGLERVEWRDRELRLQAAVDTPFPPALFSQMARPGLAMEVEQACIEARRNAAPSFSRSYFVPLPAGAGVEVMDLCVPVQQAGQEAGFLVGSFALSRVLERVLEGALSAREARRHELSLVEADGTRLARAGVARGANVYVARQLLDLPGATLQLRADSAAGRPSLLPNVTTALVMGLSLALFAVVLLLARDGRRRALAERGLAEALAFRNAMEDSLPTGLRARDLQGAVTYANPAFCAMVGFTQDELRDFAKVTGLPPYWPPEFAAEYQSRQQLRLGGHGRSTAESREGFETVFMRKNGERFPVMIYEAPLVDGEGRHTGWMSAALDISAQRRVEEISRQQQDRLQASARLATVGEMASLLSHELNQPLAAIASYASGSLNLIEAPDAETPAMLQQALTRIAEQADRAGRVIKSVHAFVRRREQQHETLSAQLLFESVLPLVRLQARKSGTRIELDLAPGGVPARVRCDRTMVEQVLLNLSRNGIQAMENDTELADRVLTLRARQTHPRWVTFTVIDAGPGIAPEVAAKLFTPFFSTRAEGMGLGLSLCRTVIEQHGGALDFGPGPGKRGTEFRFTLPSPKAAEAAESSETAGSADNP
jgi:two-component system, LuxR family, sensor histidine kinase DctS